MPGPRAWNAPPRTIGELRADVAALEHLPDDHPLELDAGTAEVLARAATILRSRARRWSPRDLTSEQLLECAAELGRRTRQAGRRVA